VRLGRRAARLGLNEEIGSRSQRRQFFHPEGKVRHPVVHEPLAREQVTLLIGNRDVQFGREIEDREGDQLVVPSVPKVVGEGETGD
jgi:hypothetical protein